MFRNLSVVLLFLLFNAQSVCLAQHPGKNEYSEINDIHDKSEQLARFSAYPVDLQIDIYLYSQYCCEGGSDTFFRFMASSGETKIPAILKRIDTDKSPDPRTKVALIEVLDFIDQSCLCLARVDGALNILERNEMNMEDTDSPGFMGFKELYHKIRERIEDRARRIK